eukprot:2529734-Pleurochrysis_carterae.AAC.2
MYRYDINAVQPENGNKAYYDPAASAAQRECGAAEERATAEREKDSELYADAMFPEPPPPHPDDLTMPDESTRAGSDDRHSDASRSHMSASPTPQTLEVVAAAPRDARAIAPQLSQRRPPRPILGLLSRWSPTPSSLPRRSPPASSTLSLPTRVGCEMLLFPCCCSLPYSRQHTPFPLVWRFSLRSRCTHCSTLRCAGRARRRRRVMFGLYVTTRSLISLEPLRYRVREATLCDEHLNLSSNSIYYLPRAASR